MAYTLLKIVSYGFAWISPIVILVSISRWMQVRSVRIGRQRVVRMMLVPAVWVLGLIGSFVGQAFHEAAWLADHPAGAATEMDMLSLGDYPNVFAGWVILGWVPVLIGLLLSRSLSDFQN